jgi:hypothetical protein
MGNRKLELHSAYTECIHCDKVIEGMGLFDTSDNTMYLDCVNCKEEMTVWNWYDDWE